MNGSNPGWVQAGWRKYWWYVNPNGYCEVKPYGGSGAYELWETSISAATHRYTWLYSPASQAWFCYIDGVNIRTYSKAYVGFTQGSWYVVQGEGHAPHVQIGKVLPEKLLFSSLQYYISGTWYTLNVTPNSPPFPYGVDEPAVGQLRVWTAASH